ncbi:MAG: cupredoxin domain-containing protein [Gammaproteobacteria bacterium]|nr:cupredoxin domain-containing protein [Gammaproteobacteria bacterium]MCW8988870.1 cupredoxin domain-containing protein [Gammaproteobacteria bacterium]
MLIVNLIGLSLVVLIIWWFWLKKPQSLKVSSNTVEIIVDNGVYSPSNIEIKLGQAVKLIFLRKDPSPCAEKVIFEKLGLSLDLPVNKPTEIRVKPEETGDYVFNCQMKMYVGHLKVNN